MIEDEIKDKESVQDTIRNTIQQMMNLTSSPNEISPGDLSSILDILEKIVYVTSSTWSNIEIEVTYLMPLPAIFL